MRGYTLIELLFVLTLLAVGASALVPTARRLADVASVTVAREDVVAVLSEARARAMTTGGSTVTILTDPARLRTSPSASIDGLLLDDTGRLELELGGGRDSTEIRFDALGIGRFANETIVLRRGDASAAVIVSSFGRVRRR